MTRLGTAVMAVANSVKAQTFDVVAASAEAEAEAGRWAIRTAVR
jgi:hypothetical protein